MKRTGITVPAWGRVCAAVAAVVLLGLGEPGARAVTLHAQEVENDTTAIALVLLPYLREALPAGPAALDPEPFCTPRLVGWRCPGEVRALVDRLGLALNSREFTLVCLGGSCRLLNVVSLVDVEMLTIEERGGRASVLVSIWRRESQRGAPLSHERRRFVLTRMRGAWRVADQ